MSEKDEYQKAVRRFLPLILGAISTVSLFLVYLAIGGARWPGNVDVCLVNGVDTCWCEAVGPKTDMVRQPHNTWSNLGFVLSGLGILTWIGFDRQPDASPAHTNPMSTGSGIAVLYGAIVVYMGWASFFFHGSMAQYAGFIDSTSLFAFTGFLVAYNVYRIWEWSDAAFHGLFWGLFALVAGIDLPLVLKSVETWPTVLVIVLAVVALVFEIWTWFRSDVPRNRLGMGFFLAAFITAGALWVFSATGRPLCDPTGPWQGHAVWHALTAVCTFLFFLYARTEDPDAPPETP